MAERMFPQNDSESRSDLPISLCLSRVQKGLPTLQGPPVWSSRPCLLPPAARPGAIPLGEGPPPGVDLPGVRRWSPVLQINARLDWEELGLRPGGEKAALASEVSGEAIKHPGTAAQTQKPLPARRLRRDDRGQEVARRSHAC